MRAISCVVVMIFLNLLMVAEVRPSAGPGLMLTPFEEDARVELDMSFQYSQPKVRSSGDRAGLFWSEGRGRVRFDRDDPHSLRIGHERSNISFSRDAEGAPDRLHDVALAAGIPLGQLDDWGFAATVGGGFAGDTPFSDSRAWYGRASIFGQTELAPNQRLVIGLEYHGNRGIFPDIPLPGVAFIHQLSDELQYTLSLPTTAVRYRPDEHWRIDLGYTIPWSGRARVGYRLTDQWELFGGFTNRFEAFHIKNDARHRRVFLQQRRLEAGLAITPWEDAQFELAGGYAFDQRLSRGFDTRSDETVERFSHEPYARLGVELRF